MKKITFILIIFLTLFSCSSKVVFEKEYEIKNNKWQAENVINFKFKVEDNSLNYNMFFTMHNSKKYRTSNIWLYVITSSPSGKSVTDSLEYFLSDDKGVWRGQDNSDFIKNKFLYKSNIKFTENGEYNVSVTQGMREKDTPNIKTFGLVVEKTE